MFVPTVFVDNEILHRVQTGDIVLTPGQWIQIAWLDEKSRFVGVTPRAQCFWGVHKHKRNAFKTCRDNFKKLPAAKPAAVVQWYCDDCDHFQQASAVLSESKCWNCGKSGNINPRRRNPRLDEVAQTI
jgi:hypothetical protein